RRGGEIECEVSIFIFRNSLPEIDREIDDVGVFVEVQPNRGESLGDLARLCEQNNLSREPRLNRPLGASRPRALRDHAVTELAGRLPLRQRKKLRQRHPLWRDSHTGPPGVTAARTILPPRSLGIEPGYFATIWYTRWLLLSPLNVVTYSSPASSSPNDEICN